MDGDNADRAADEIVVRAYTPRYAAAADRLGLVEGGHANDPLDRGGETQFGISLRFLKAEGAIDLDGDGLADFDLDMDGDIDGADVRQLTRGDARYLFHRCFWLRLDADNISPPIGEMMFDQAVNGGLTAAKKLLQRAINAIGRKYHYRGVALRVDGVIDKDTRATLGWLIERHGMREVAAAYREAAKDRYRAIVQANPSQARFLKGWLRRADELGAT